MSNRVSLGFDACLGLLNLNICLVNLGFVGPGSYGWVWLITVHFDWAKHVLGFDGPLSRVLSFMGVLFVHGPCGPGLIMPIRLNLWQLQVALAGL